MESLSFKDIKVGKSYQISVSIGIENFYFKGVKIYYVNVESINKIEDRYLITGDYFIKDTNGSESYYYNLDEIFAEIKEISIKEVVYDVFQEKKTIAALKTEITKNAELMVKTMDRRFLEQEKRYTKLAIITAITVGLFIVNLILGL